MSARFIDEDGFAHTPYEEWVGYPMTACSCGEPWPCEFVRCETLAAGIGDDRPRMMQSVFPSVPGDATIALEDIDDAGIGDNPT